MAVTKTKKIDKKFLITDSTINVYGFRLLTEGYLKAEFEKNPIGYYMHDREDGVVVRWEDLSLEGDKVYGKPVINLSNERGQQTVDEIENGFLNGASVGHIVALEYSEDPSMMLPGQTGPTVTKWYNRECSLVDVPGNMNALCLYDKEGNVINLADFKNKTHSNMKQIFLSAAQLAMIPNLKANPEQADVDQAFNDLVAAAQKATTLETQLSAAKNENTRLVAENTTLKQAGEDKAVTDLLAKALNEEKKITKEIHDLFAVQYKGKSVELKAVLDLMQPIGGAVKNLLDKTKQAGASGKKFEGKTFEQLDTEGLLEDLKAEDPDKFFDMWKENFGTPHKQDKRDQA
jgi:hypothetical protein